MYLCVSHATPSIPRKVPNQSKIPTNIITLFQPKLRRIVLKSILDLWPKSIIFVGLENTYDR
jgi:hypothetical protein